LKFKGNEKFAFDCLSLAGWLASVTHFAQQKTSSSSYQIPANAEKYFFGEIFAADGASLLPFSNLSSRPAQRQRKEIRDRPSTEKAKADRELASKEERERETLVHIPLSTRGIFIQLTKYFLQISILQSQT
jgi:hypothetical protein